MKILCLICLMSLISFKVAHSKAENMTSELEANLINMKWVLEGSDQSREMRFENVETKGLIMSIYSHNGAPPVNFTVELQIGSPTVLTFSQQYPRTTMNYNAETHCLDHKESVPGIPGGSYCPVSVP